MNDICSIEGCQVKVRSRELCPKHYREWQAAQAPPCPMDGCDRPAVRTSTGLCEYHHRKQKDPKGPCSIEGCDKPINCREMCKNHYDQWLYHQDKGPCSVDGCEKNAVVGRGLCNNHYALYRDSLKEPCSVNNCDRQSRVAGFCNAHYGRMLRIGDVLEDEPIRISGQIPINENGYAVLEGSFVHRTIMAELIQRPLLSHENVHHKNGQRADNRPKNLELWSSSQPSGQRVVDKLEWAYELIELYKGTDEDAEAWRRVYLEQGTHR